MTAAPRPPRPLGFTLIALWLGTRTAARFGDFIGGAPDWGDPASILQRFLTGGAIVLAGVTVAALWRVERWAHRAYGGWVAAVFLRNVAGMAGTSGMDAADALGVAMFTSLLPFFLFFYVQGRLDGLYPAGAPAPAHLPPPARVPAPPPARARTPWPRP